MKPDFPDPWEDGKGSGVPGVIAFDSPLPFKLTTVARVIKLKTASSSC